MTVQKGAEKKIIERVFNSKEKSEGKTINAIFP